MAGRLAIVAHPSASLRVERTPDLNAAQQPPAERVHNLELCGMRGHACVALWASVGCHRSLVLGLMLLLLRRAPLSIAAPTEDVRALRDDWVGHQLRADLSKGGGHIGMSVKSDHPCIVCVTVPSGREEMLMLLLLLRPA